MAEQPDLKRGANLALLTLSSDGLAVAEALRRELPEAHLYLHNDVPYAGIAERFLRVIACTEEIFARYRGLVYIMPTGVVMRAIAAHVVHKRIDPAVVVVDVCGRWAIPLLAGHEGGANRLAERVANALGAEPIITTSSEAERRLIVGVGCRRGVSAALIRSAVEATLANCGRTLGEVRTLASADLKQEETGLLEAAAAWGLPIRFLPGAVIQASPREFTHNPFVEERVGLPAVAEAAALLAGTRTELICPKQVHPQVTVAVAKENCTWSGSAPAAP